jgi:hypothetical protein
MDVSDVLDTSTQSSSHPTTLSKSAHGLKEKGEIWGRREVD